MPKFAISTLGCKVNAYESEAYCEQLLQLGYTQVDFKECADIYIINTCAVTNTAASKSRQKINHAKKSNDKAFVCVVGCLIQTSVEELDVNLLIGSQKKDQLAQMIHTNYHCDIKVKSVSELEDNISFEQLNVHSFAKHTRAYLKVQDGCNQFCSYCIIPFARGRERSLEMDKAIEQAKRLVANKHKEIVLSGIHTGRYGRDYGYDLLSLLKKMNQIEGLERIRISSIEMNELNEEFIDFIKNNKKMAKHLHIPVQSCCDDILKAMNRPYIMNDYISKIEMIRKKIPYISISTDIILGFPNESIDQYNECVDNYKKIQFSFAHVFPFSKRDGTKACEINNHLSGTIKKERCKKISQISNIDYNNYKEKFIHQQVEVLFESRKGDYLFGHSSEYLPVYAKLDDIHINEVVSVIVSDIKEGNLYAE